MARLAIESKAEMIIDNTVTAFSGARSAEAN
jgi:hypothetical protein